jgi:hypothetical protein
MLEMLKKLILQCDVFAAPAVAQDAKVERRWFPLYNC